MIIKHHKGWTTHMAMLMKTVDKCQGNVLELGAGVFSTPLLHWMCKERNKKLVTIEGNEEFYKFAREFQSPLHRIKLISDLVNFPINEHWGVVFVDHDSPGQNRGKDALRFKNHADYIVLHDSEKETEFGYNKIWTNFKYRYDWKECRPWTSVVSNFQDLQTLGNEKGLAS